MSGLLPSKLRFRRTLLVLWTAALLGIGSSAIAEADEAARIANIESAAARIGELQAEKGALGAIDSISGCYKRETAEAVSLTPGLEACMTQDIVVSRTSAAIYGSVGPEALKKSGGADPKLVLDAMYNRVAGVLGRFAVPEDSARRFAELVNQYGMAAYQQALMPARR